MKKINQKQKVRLSYIDFKANFLGEIGRKEIVKRFGIGDAAASKDLAEYMNIAPNNLSYDFKTKTHRPTQAFKAVFSFSVDQIFKALSTGLGDTFEGTSTPFLSCQPALKLNQPNTDILAQVSRAINLKKIVRVNYFSLSSGFKERDWVPFAIVDSGLRWHIRAFDRYRKDFRDFVFTRIKSIDILENEKIANNETPENDSDWNRTVCLKLVPHPSNIDHSEAIKMDYNMPDGCLTISPRAAVAPYILRNWNVDCTKDHSLKEKYYQLWLANRDEIEGIEKFTIAPGIERQKSNHSSSMK